MTMMMVAMAMLMIIMVMMMGATAMTTSLSQSYATIIRPQKTHRNCYTSKLVTTSDTSKLLQTKDEMR